MAPAGLAAIERAKANGSWTMLEDVENLVVPDDLAAALDAAPVAAANWAAFSPTTRRGFLEWVRQAKRPATRAARIERTVELAARNERTPTARPPTEA